MGNQIISTTVPGPIFSNGGAITVTSSGKINGQTNGGDGVEAVSASITTLSNSGAIDGGFGGPRISGGVGVFAAAGESIGTLFNAAGATIIGGNGGTSARGGAGVLNAGTITTLSNNGLIGGGNGGSSSGAGGVGLSNFGTITTLTKEFSANK